MSADATTLYAVNTPDNHLEIFDLSSGVPVHKSTVSVGLEPVAVAVGPNGFVWVVNHLSDSVSIVDVTDAPARIVQTLLVGDEPRDIVFAGSNGERAFITTAHRGQNTGFDPALTSPGQGRADVWVFNALAPGNGMGGQAETIINLFGDTPRALAASSDGSRVYAGVFHSGNRTTVLEADIENGGLDKPPPLASVDGQPQPATGLIIKYDGENWIDNGDPTNGIAGKTWNERVRFSLPDIDVFAIDALADPPLAVDTARGVGSTLFNIAVNPVSGKLYVSNTEARNHVRFEGPGSHGTTVRGHFVESRISVITRNGVNPRHLNKHINTYQAPLGSASDKQNSLATPLGMAVSGDGKTLYVAAYGSSRIGIFDTSELEQDSFVPAAANHIVVSGGGPSGLVLDASREQIYVMTRFDNGISTLDITTRTEIDHITLHNPEPDHVIAGRPLLYDARLSSSRGDSSCAGCHTFGDMDHLAWDLGNPDEARLDSPNIYNNKVPPSRTKPYFHPMKGPMTTQSFRGMRGNGPMHWRGDRTGVNREPGESVEEQSFEDFNVAFTGLLGRESELSESQMDAFAKFALELSYPPNPIRALDNSLTPSQAAGRDFYLNIVSDTIATCDGCHRLNPANGQFGTDGTQSVEGGSIEEDFKIPQLRNMYQKVGMFGSTGNPANGEAHTGPQVRGFGFAHDGAKATLRQFLSVAVFRFPSEAVRAQVVDFMLAFPTEHAPIVGQQLTISEAAPANGTSTARLQLLLQRASLDSPECELIVKGVIDDAPFGAVLNPAGSFVAARAVQALLKTEELLALAGRKNNALTFTCMPLGSGNRAGIDRDLDGILDGDDTELSL
jgi:DNA-binding beta-propeller fold protein YncE/mono/diheme cytochrome c family protein